MRPEWASADEAKVIRSFFENGLLTSIPAQRSKRLVVLRYLADTVFETQAHAIRRRKSTSVSARSYPDPASLRRYLVDEGFMARKSGEYRLRPRSDWPLYPAPAGRGSALARERER